jgi:hypothetical protein
VGDRPSLTAILQKLLLSDSLTIRHGTLRVPPTHKRGFMKSRFLITCSMALSLGLGLSARAQQQGKEIMVTESKPYVATSNAVQSFSESINVPKGQEKLDLKLTYYNGLNGAPGFRWIRINSSTMSYFTEKDFAGQSFVTHDVTGDLGAGGNQILIQCAGVAGSSFAWKLTTIAPSIASVVPPNPAPGETFVIKGSNLSSDPTADVGTFNGTNIPAISATSSSVTFKIPENIRQATDNSAWPWVV